MKNVPEGAGLVSEGLLVSGDQASGSTGPHVHRTRGASCCLDIDRFLLSADSPSWHAATFVAGRRGRKFYESPIARTHAQLRAQLESPRARVRYIPRCEFSHATGARPLALQWKSNSFLPAYGFEQLPVQCFAKRPRATNVLPITSLHLWILPDGCPPPAPKIANIRIASDRSAWHHVRPNATELTQDYLDA